MSKAEEYATLLREMHEAKAASIDGSNHKAYFAAVDRVEAWEEQNRDLITDALRQHEDPRRQRALRLLDAVENPSEELLASIGNYCIENGAEGCALGGRDEELGGYALTALREAIQ